MDRIRMESCSYDSRETYIKPPTLRKCVNKKSLGVLNSTNFSLWTAQEFMYLPFASRDIPILLHHCNQLIKMTQSKRHSGVASTKWVMLPEEILSCWPFKIKMFGNVIILYFKMVPNVGTNHKNTFVQQIVIYSWSDSTT